MGQDLRFALRMISSHRWFSAAVVAVLALGIGLNTMVFTLIDAVLFKPVPVPGGDRLVAIVTRDLQSADRDRQHMPLSWPDFIDYRNHATSLEALEAGSGDGAILSEHGIPPQHYNMFRISPGFFGMLHVPPVRGRDFTAGDDKFGAAPVALIGYGVWKNRYGGRDVMGRVVRVNGKPATIVGVMPEGFRFPAQEDLWMPLEAGADLADRSLRPLQLFGIRKAGVGLAQAVADFDVISRRLAHEYPKEDKNTAAVVQTFHQRYNGDEIELIFSLMTAAVGFVLLIACANVANMMLGRALGRRREISIRVAMGASRWRIVRQLLTESLSLSVLGGFAGLGLAALGVHFFDLATQDVGKPYWVQFTIDYRVFVYFAAVCVLSSLLFGLAPALRSTRDVNTGLKDGMRTAGTQRGGRLSSLLVVFQFALTLVLLLSAGVFIRTFADQQSVNGWVPGNQLMTARINLPGERYKDAASRRRFFEQFLARAARIPGIRSIALTSDLPGSGSGKRRIEIEGAPPRDQGHGPSASVVMQSPGYPATIDLPLLQGRDFNTADGLPGQLHAIVTREFARHFWGKEDALGRRFRFFEKNKPGDWISVIGVFGDIVQQPLEPASEPLLFLPYNQEAYDSMALLARTPRPAAAVSAIRAVLQEMDQDLPLSQILTMTEMKERQIWFLRLFETVFLVFASIALLIASVGIYAVMAQATGSRTQEIGVRMALGATSASILRLVLKRGILQLTAGLGLGSAVAYPAARAMASLRFLDAPSDPLIVAAVGSTLLVVGLFACWLPARRAAALNPVSAIRNE